MMVAGGERRREMVFNGYRVSVLQDENLLEMEKTGDSLGLRASCAGPVFRGYEGRVSRAGLGGQARRLRP